MALTDVYQLIMKQTVFAELAQNVFTFEKLDPLGTAEDLVDGFITDYLAEIRRVQSSSVGTYEVSAINLGDFSDFHSEPVALGGLAGAGDTMPAFNAVGYSLRPNTRLVRPGSKRFSGIPEAVVLNGVITEPGYVDAVEDVRIKLDDNVVGVLSDYQHVIVKRIKEPVTGTVPLRYTYRMPTTGDTLVLGLVTQAFSNLEVTSQVSRKP